MGLWGLSSMGALLPSPEGTAQRTVPRCREGATPGLFPRAAPRKDATVKIVVMGDANADWLAYGLEDAFSKKTDIGIVRKHRTDSGLIRYGEDRGSECPLRRARNRAQP
jgi:hypothetical protein